MGNRQDEAEVLGLLGRAHLDAGEAARAQALAAQALDLHRAVRSPAGEVAR